MKFMDLDAVQVEPERLLGKFFSSTDTTNLNKLKKLETPKLNIISKTSFDYHFKTFVDFYRIFS